MQKVFNLILVLLITIFIPFSTVHANPLQGEEGSECIDSAIGCFPIVDGDQFLGFILGWAIGIAGGIALLLIVYAGVIMITAGGNPEKVQAGKELLTAAIGGFIFLLFSAYILRFVGVDILQIPGF